MLFLVYEWHFSFYNYCQLLRFVQNVFSDYIVIKVINGVNKIFAFVFINYFIHFYLETLGPLVQDLILEPFYLHLVGVLIGIGSGNGMIASSLSSLLFDELLTIVKGSTDQVHLEDNANYCEYRT